MEMIKPMKGKDLAKVPLSRLRDGPWFISKKHDGHRTQIQYNSYTEEVKFFTSGGKQYHLENLARFIKDHFVSCFTIECEFNYDCEGLLGDRGKSAILTTYRTNWNNGETTWGDPEKDIFRVFDLVDKPLMPFAKRQAWIQRNFGLLYSWFKVPPQILISSLEVAESKTAGWVKEGFEGAMLVNPNSLHQPGKRSNDIIKLKPRKTADLLCIDTKLGTGKYEGMIGSLLLKDSNDVTVWAGSGLDDWARSQSPQSFIGTVFEIEFERIDDTYIQPIIKHRRGDKLPTEID